MDERVVIPLHDESEPQRRRSAVRRSARPPRPADGSADVYAFNGAAEFDGIDDIDHVAPALPAAGWERRASKGLAFLRRRLTGNYSLDDYGFDPDLAENVLLPVFRALYDNWFRVEVNGLENIPNTGGALLLANHSGGLWALDAAMMSVAIRERHPVQRHLRMLADQFVFSTPGLSVLARRAGATLACPADAERLLNAGELVGAWPEGFAGLGKPFRDRYQLQRFSRGGFVSSAIAAGVPIIPVSIVGAEETHPVLGNARSLARLLDLPYFPLTPTFPWLGPLGLVPLPSKWYIEFGAPISTEDAEGGRDVFELTDQVRETIQTSLYRLLVQRRSVWR
ncbi:lysophospholipid acyltransferase family protein [Jatrophihabitans sp.]|uniref:lysophospholipid acyltransferase family protein n=1 Tax=Jatrophihabitans sp. TaxID=1932789 RepID=UPI0030C6EA2C|nr:2-acyl-glycerophospho-ethanolamine acyltransferase [Jatrophihabitans sp.]